jgi:serine/threonine protein kinase
MSNIKDYEPLWGSWTVDALIGEGSFGKVYRVKREEFGRTYYSAVKIISVPQNDADLRSLRGELDSDASVKSYYRDFVSDLIGEIDLMEGFKGTGNIVAYEDHRVVEHADGLGYDILIRMELLESLSARTADKPLSESEIIKLGVDICRALEVCAVKNVIHRDIKPDNIFVNDYGDFKLGDFGIARQVERTMSGLSKKGTYTYMAPEVYRGEMYGASVDTYSLGIVLYRLLNKNRTPFLPEYPSQVLPRDRDTSLQRRMGGENILPIKSVGGDLNAVVLKACAYNRTDRYATAAELREALESITDGGSYAPKNTPMCAASPIAEKPREDSTNSTVGVFASRPADDYREATSKTEGVWDSKPPLPPKVPPQAPQPPPPPEPPKRYGKWIALTASYVIIASIVIILSAMNSTPSSIQDDLLVLSEVTDPPTDAPTAFYSPTAAPTPEYITIKGIEYSTNITELALTEYELTNANIEPLKYMTNLTTLSLTETQISDIVPLAGLTNLQVLVLGANQISDISPLAGLTNLWWLDLQSSPISDITPLVELTNLQVLVLQSTLIDDVTPLVGLTNLLMLDLQSTPISDVTPLEGLTNLRWLYIFDNNLTQKQLDDLQVALPNCYIGAYLS